MRTNQCQNKRALRSPKVVASLLGLKCNTLMILIEKHSFLVKKRLSKINKQIKQANKQVQKHGEEKERSTKHDL